MAASLLSRLPSPAKCAAIVACGAAATAVGYVAWTKYHSKFYEDRDEGFVDVSKIEEFPEKKVLVLGLDGAGKSYLLAALGKQEQPVITKPTEGFNVMCIQTDKVSLNLWEIGGAENMRKYWTNFIVDTCVLVFVVDSTEDEKRLSLAFDEFHKLLGDDRLKHIPFIIVAAKQDLPHSRSGSDILHALGLDNISPREHAVKSIETSVPEEGVAHGVDELQQLLLSLSV